MPRTETFEQQCVELEQVAERVVRRLGHEIRSLLGEGMTPAQFFVLRLTGQTGPLTVSELSEQLGVTPSAVTSLADRLVASGLVDRVRSDADRRVVLLSLSPAGTEKLAELEQKRTQMMRNYLSRLPGEDVARLLSILERLAVVIGQPDTDQSVTEVLG